MPEISQRSNYDPNYDRAVFIIATILLLVALLYVAALAFGSPRVAWDAARVAPAVSMTMGYRLYYPPGEGPILNFIYGPVATLVLLPAALASSPTGAVLIAAAIIRILFFGPLLAVHFLLARDRSMAVIGSLIAVSMVLAQQSLSGSAMRIHVDAPALGFAMLATAVLLRRGKHSVSSDILIATFAALSVWSKQSMLPLLVALPAVVWLRDGWRSALRLVIVETVVFALLGASFCFAFGARAMWFNMVVVPGHHPWIFEDRGRLFSVIHSLCVFLKAHALLFGVTVALVAVAGVARDRFRASPAAAHLLIAAIMLPAAVVGFCKVGGDVNNFSLCSVFILLAGTASVASMDRDTLQARIVSIAATAICAGVSLPLLSPAVLYREVVTYRENPQQIAFAAAKRYPQQIYFPWAPLATLYADRKLYHFEYGVFDRNLGGQRPTDSQLRAFLPARMTYIAYQRDRSSRLMMEMIGKFTKPTDLAGLTKYRVYRK